MKASELQDLLISTLARKSGGSQRRWRIALGPIQLRDISTHPHCNWSVTPPGGSREIADIERLLDDVRIAHPIVVKG
ncbi:MULTISPECIES: hypothetical protein [unclassified Sphingomonas]|uniref:hypothetical protein n=1 Tax=unclassified Sphingomonas TaxID=196159 RepID=UPI0009EB64BD|nr:MULTISPECIES: hypothetical protein [unclassified Sphingomonas]